MRSTILWVGLTAMIGACAVEVGEDVGAQDEALYTFPGMSVDGTPCCAKDYREGGETIVCGKRYGEWCCENEAQANCHSCSYYECEPPPETPTAVHPVSPVYLRYRAP